MLKFDQDFSPIIIADEIILYCPELVLNVEQLSNRISGQS